MHKASLWSGRSRVINPRILEPPSSTHMTTSPFSPFSFHYPFFSLIMFVSEKSFLNLASLSELHNHLFVIHLLGNVWVYLVNFR